MRFTLKTHAKIANNEVIEKHKRKQTTKRRRGK